MQNNSLETVDMPHTGSSGIIWCLSSSSPLSIWFSIQDEAMQVVMLSCYAVTRAKSIGLIYINKSQCMCRTQPL